MKRDEFDHVLCAAAHALGQHNFLVIGTAAILGSYPEESLPARATKSREADLAPFDDPDGDKSMLLEGVLGLGSQFEKARISLMPKDPIAPVQIDRAIRWLDGRQPR